MGSTYKENGTVIFLIIIIGSQRVRQREERNENDTVESLNVLIITHTEAYSNAVARAPDKRKPRYGEQRVSI